MCPPVGNDLICFTIRMEEVKGNEMKWDKTRRDLFSIKFTLTPLQDIQHIKLIMIDVVQYKGF